MEIILVGVLTTLLAGLLGDFGLAASRKLSWWWTLVYTTGAPWRERVRIRLEAKSFLADELEELERYSKPWATVQVLWRLARDIPGDVRQALPWAQQRLVGVLASRLVLPGALVVFAIASLVQAIMDLDPSFQASAAYGVAMLGLSLITLCTAVVVAVSLRIQHRLRS